MLGAASDAAHATEDAVLADLEVALYAKSPNRDVVRLRTGEVVERGAVRLGSDDAKVGLHPGSQGDGALGLAVCENLRHLGIPYEAPRHRRPLARRDEHVDVPDRLAATSQAPGDVDGDDLRRRFEVGQERRGMRIGLGEAESTRASALIRAALEDALLEDLADSANGMEPANLGCGLEILERLQSKLVVEEFRPLWPHAVDAHHHHKALRNLRHEIAPQGKVTRREDLHDLGGEILSDPR